MPTSSSQIGAIVQDVPVSTLAPSRLAECEEPAVENDVGLLLPSLQKLYSILDKMKALGNIVEVKTSIHDKATLALNVRDL